MKRQTTPGFRDDRTSTIAAVDLVRRYERAWLWPDVAAGLVLTALLVPQGMAYAELAGLPAVTGLYTTVLGLLAYALLGPSRTLVLGPDSSLAPLIAVAVLPLAAGDPAEAVALAGLLAVMVGIVMVVVGLARLGSITELLSRPVRIGYLNGIAVFVLISQLPKLFGFSTDADGILPQLTAFLEGLADGEANSAALTLGLASLLIILAGRRWAPRVPAVLFAVVATTIVVAAFDLQDAGVSVVGPLPGGFPRPEIPDVSWTDIRDLVGATMGIALVAFADTSALSTSFARARGDSVDPNREIVALGAANLLSGLFRGFPLSASTSRTAVADSLGSRSQLTGVVGAVAIVVLLVAGNSLLQDLPSATLAAIVIAASLSIFDLQSLVWMWHVRRSEWILSMVALAGVLTFGVLEGIVIAVTLSLGNFVRTAWRPHDAVLGRVSGVKGYHDIERHPEADAVPGLLVFRFDSPLFFANADHFERRLRDLVSESAEPVAWVLLAAEPVTDVDTTAADTMTRVIDFLDERGIQFAVAEMKGPVKDRLAAYGLYGRIGDEFFFPTLGTAISAYVKTTGVEWKDWTDEK